MDLSTLDRDGYVLVDPLLDAADVARLVRWSASLPADESAVARRGLPFARRNLLDDALIRELANEALVRAIVEPVLGRDAIAVRAILFDKTPDANWAVPWHQDRSIAVEEKRDVPGFGPWSEKAGVVHVQPPIDVLRAMLTVRIHIDPCDADNGPLRVIAGTHMSLLDAEAVNRTVQSSEAVSCCVGAGGAVVMRPLMLHASSPARRADHRRTIHIEFAADALPGELRWRFSA